MSQSLCPACGSIINDSTNVCSCCGLKNLNQTFFTKIPQNAVEATESESFIKDLIPKIFVGRDNVLFLTYDGELYGVGKNDKHQLASSDDLWFDVPVHLAHGVKSVAAGLDYVIWVDKVGRVHLKGSGEYSDLFQGFDGITKVLADPFENIFWLINNQGEVYVFGNNFNGVLFPLTEQEVYLGEAGFGGDFHTNYRPYGSSRNDEFYYLSKSRCSFQGVNYYFDEGVKGVKQSFEEISKYTTLLKEYGRINIELKIILKSQHRDNEAYCLTSSSSEEKRTEYEWRLYQASAIIKNLHIIRPVKTSLTEAEIKIPQRKHQRYFHQLTPIPHSMMYNESCLESMERQIKENGHFQSQKGEKSSYDVVEVYEREGGNIYVMLTRDYKILLARTEKLFVHPYYYQESNGINVYAMNNSIPQFIEHTSFYIF